MVISAGADLAAIRRERGGTKRVWSNTKSFLRRHAPALRHVIAAQEGLSEDIRRKWWRFQRTAQIAAWLQQPGLHRLQLGAGPHAARGWLNTDLNPRSEVGRLFLDVTEPFPFPDNSIDCIFSEHLIEHVGFREGGAMLRECYRVLRPGGWLRIATPDLSVVLALLDRNLNAIQQAYVKDVVDRFVPGCPRPDPIFAINTLFRAHGHEFLYDELTLRTLLAEAGFAEITRYAMGESRNPDFVGLDAHGRRTGRYEVSVFETMAFEAHRPS